MAYPDRLFTRNLDTVGDGSGSNDMVVDGGTTPVEFSLIPGAGEVYQVHRMMIQLIDGKTGFIPTSFGAITALTNGVEIAFQKTSDDSVLWDVLDGEPIKTNGGWGRLGYDVNILDFGSGASDYVLLSRFSFDKFGGPVTLTPSEKLVVTINDALAGIDVFNIFVQGSVSR